MLNAPRLSNHHSRTWTRRAAGAALALTLASPALGQVLSPLLRPAISQRGTAGLIVVADRASSTATVIDVATDTVTATLDFPAADNPAEPMYVWYSPAGHRFFIGDRGNDRVVAFDAGTLQAVAEAPAGMGVFHMWGSAPKGQLWVNNDIEKTTSVIDVWTLETIATVPTPADLVAMGGKPHDVILSPEGDYAYVTVLGVDGPMDWVVQYDTGTFLEIGRAPVGADPHLSVTYRNNDLYLPCQGDGSVYVLDRDTLAGVAVLSVPGAHGAGLTFDGRYFYATNISGGGTDALWTIDTDTNQIVGSPVDAPYAAPHNIALTRDGGKLYVTHSGMNNKVSVYQTIGDDPTPVYLGEVTTGNNPFGLAWVPSVSVSANFRR